MNKKDFNSFNKSNTQKINNDIRSPRVILIDDNGINHGNVSNQEARSFAYDSGLDLVEIQTGDREKGIWPVCKIMDYGKMKYEKSKKKKSDKKPALKEIMFHVKTAEHDLCIKMNKVVKLLSKGHQVKFGVTIKGRERLYKSDARKKLDQQIEKVKQVSSFDGIIEGDRIIYTMLTPLS